MVRDGGDGAPPRSVLTKVDAVIIFIVIILCVCVRVCLCVCVCTCVLSWIEPDGSSRHRCVKVAASGAIYEPSALR